MVKWMFTPIYAFPNAACQAIMWTYLQKLGNYVAIPWLLLWDTNQPLEVADKKGGNVVN